MGDGKQKLTNFSKDTRIPCKYGAECYQKNPFHLSKYKHPPKQKDESETQRPTKKRKIEVKKEMKFTNKISESDDASERENGEGNNTKKLEASGTLNTPGSSFTNELVTEAKDNDEPVQSERKIKNDVSDSEDETVKYKQISDANDIEKPLHNKCKIRNEVSDSEDDSETNKIMQTKITESPSKTKFKIRNDVSDSEDDAETCGGEQEERASKKENECPQNLDNTNEVPKVNQLNNDLPKASFDKKEFIKSKFLVEMPPDFYAFWELCKKMQATNPLFALKDVGLTLVGPYDVLAGKFNDSPERDANEYLIHWRYYFDVPEFQTVLKGDGASGYHIGYFRDSPNELPVFLASNRAQSDGAFAEMGDNIFTAVSLYLEDLKKTSDPFKKLHISRFSSLIKAEAEKLNLNLSAKTQAMRDRYRKTVAKTFNKIGLVVPYNRKTQVGYRELALPDKELKQLLEQLAITLPEQRSNLLVKLQPVLTFASIAADECDFGTSVELGWDIMYCGVESLNSTVASFLATAYRLLKRDAFASITEAHMKNRRKGSSLSIL